MKLLVVGGTGFVATELIRQALAHPSITGVVALARRPVPVPSDLPPGADASKLKSVVLKDFETYDDEVKKEMTGVGGVIWTIAITPSKVNTMPFEEVRKICHDYTVAGLDAIFEVRDKSTPLRFCYMSGEASERDQNAKPTWMPEYTLLRGNTENHVLDFASSHPGEIEVSIAKPGLILQPGNMMHRLKATALWLVASLPNLSVVEISAAMLDQVVNGFEKDTMRTVDLTRLGRRAIEGEKAKI